MSGHERRIISPSVKIYEDPELTKIETVGLYGEPIILEDVSSDGVKKLTSVRVHTPTDRSVGYLNIQERVGAKEQVTDRVATQRTIVYERPDFKSTSIAQLPFNALIRRSEELDGYVHVKNLGWVATEHLVSHEFDEQDPVRVARTFLNVPYVWGGRDAIVGVDCSALVQHAYLACGISLPRNTAPMEVSIERTVKMQQVREGDLVFWRGHVAIVSYVEPRIGALPDIHIIHATVKRHAVVEQTLESAIQERLRDGDGPITSIRRVLSL